MFRDGQIRLSLSLSSEPVGMYISCIFSSIEGFMQKNGFALGAINIYTVDRFAETLRYIVTQISQICVCILD